MHRREGLNNRPFVLGALVTLLIGHWSSAIGNDDDAKLLAKADAIKTSNYAEFLSIVEELGKRPDELSAEQSSYLRFLKGWRSAYEGQYRLAVEELTPIVEGKEFPTMRIRAGATMTNVLVLSAQYQPAFLQLNRFLALLPETSDKAAREQALAVASYMYTFVGEYDLSLRHAQSLIDENYGNRGACIGGQLKTHALYQSGKLTAADPYLPIVIGACDQIGERVRASATRTYLAKRLMDEKRYQEAMTVLTSDYEQTRQSRSPQILSDYDSLLAQIYMQLGDRASAKQYATRTINDGVKNEFTEPLSKAYWILYSLAKSNGEQQAALAFHEKYAAADKGYLDDTTARQVVYERVKHEVAEGRLQIEGLNKQNEVLKLQQQLGDKTVENLRLYIILSTLVLAFIILWAYKTKRSQLHFMKLSRQDGLTGIFNRPHFIDQATRALNAAKKSGQEISVAICDLDHFKAINDTCGHAAGDDVLKKTAVTFLSELGKNDIVGRLGGEEFGILLLDCDLATAQQRCEKLRSALATITIDENGTPTNLSASFGIAVTASSGHDFRQLLAHADSALYRAKRTGRNRVVSHGAESNADNSSAVIDERRLRA